MSNDFTCNKITENRSKFYSSLLEISGKYPFSFLFLLLQQIGDAMDQIETLLILMLTSYVYQGAIC